MHAYAMLLSASCLVCAVSAGCVFAQDPRSRTNQLSGGLMLAVAFWALCETAWNLATDPGVAVALVRASGLGWILIAPLFFHLAVDSLRRASPRLQRLVPWVYAPVPILLWVTWTTDWVTRDVMKTSWGWAYVPGPGLFVVYAGIMLAVSTGFFLVLRDVHQERSPAERRQGPWIAVGTSLPMLVAGLTDVVLPLAGVQVPRLGTTSFAVMSLMAVTTLRRFGYSFMTTSTFAGEILESLPDGVALVQRDERISSANEGLARLTRRKRGDLTNRSISEILTHEDADCLDAQALLERGLGDEIECQLVQVDGERIAVSITTASLRDPQGFPIGVVLVVRDQREVAGLRSRLVTSARLAAVGELAAGIAHEINNPIAFVRTNLGQLRSHWKQLRDHFDASDPASNGLAELFQDGDEMIEESLEGVNRAAEIVRNVQGFSHGGHADREAADLNHLLESVIRMAATQMRGRVAVDRYYADLPAVWCAPQELKQVFLNLIVNAGHAIGEHGTIEVRTESLGEMVRVSIVDDGCGIDPRILDRIFDPFFTTKRVGDGTGLGLGIAYQIVRNHEGEITAASTPGEGTRFRVLLPIGSPDLVPDEDESNDPRNPSAPAP